tara:strand:+ start:27774 stop:28100 length:327 start_codon:yes stop_codon:yes gene_type:complete
MVMPSPTDFSRSREVQFLNREESRFPHLQRLSLDFSFQVLEIALTSKPEKHFALVTDDYRSTELESITPHFSTLAELNEYVGDNMIDILHDYLFGFVEEDIQMAKSYA